MARIKKNIQKVVEASSLLETVISMMVIMLVFFVAMMVYVNIIRNSVGVAELSANQQLHILAIEIQKNKNYVNETIELETVTILKKTTNYNDQLIQLELEAQDKAGRTITTRKELILERDE